MAAPFGDRFVSDVTFGGVGGDLHPCGVLSCTAPLRPDLPDVHYCVVDTACLADAVQQVQRLGFTHHQFTPFSSCARWLLIYGHHAPI